VVGFALLGASTCADNPSSIFGNLSIRKKEYGGMAGIVGAATD